MQNLIKILKQFYGLSLRDQTDENPGSKFLETYPTLAKHLAENVDDNGNYTAHANHADTPAGHLANWEKAAIWTEMLKGFCSLDRDKIKEPFRVGDWVYATNGKVAIRLPYHLAPEVQVKPLTPNGTASFFETLPSNTIWKSLDEFGPITPKIKNTCDNCRGHGYNTLKIGNPKIAGEECYNCHGAGHLIVPTSVEIKSNLHEYLAIGSETLVFFSLLPDVEWTIARNNNHFAGRFANGVGEVIGIMKLQPDDYATP